MRSVCNHNFLLTTERLIVRYPHNVVKRHYEVERRGKHAKLIYAHLCFYSIVFNTLIAQLFNWYFHPIKFCLTHAIRSFQYTVGKNYQDLLETLVHPAG